MIFGGRIGDWNSFFVVNERLSQIGLNLSWPLAGLLDQDSGTWIVCTVRPSWFCKRWVLQNPRPVIIFQVSHHPNFSHPSPHLRTRFDGKTSAKMRTSKACMFSATYSPEAPVPSQIQVIKRFGAKALKQKLSSTQRDTHLPTCLWKTNKIGWTVQAETALWKKWYLEVVAAPGILIWVPLMP